MTFATMSPFEYLLTYLTDHYRQGTLELKHHNGYYYLEVKCQDFTRHWNLNDFVTQDKLNEAAFVLTGELQAHLRGK
jgi:hypothetical protein